MGSGAPNSTGQECLFPERIPRPNLGERLSQSIRQGHDPLLNHVKGIRVVPHLEDDIPFIEGSQLELAHGILRAQSIAGNVTDRRATVCRILTMGAGIEGRIEAIF
jgi:hypothetical protein